MWYFKVTNLATGEVHEAECKFMETAIHMAWTLKDHAIVPYKCSVKYVGGDKNE